MVWKLRQLSSMFLLVYLSVEVCRLPDVETTKEAKVGAPSRSNLVHILQREALPCEFLVTCSYYNTVPRRSMWGVLAE